MRDLKALFYLFIPVYYIYVASLDILIAKRSAITLIIGGIASIFVTLSYSIRRGLNIIKCGFPFYYSSNCFSLCFSHSKFFGVIPSCAL